ncbi:EAL domain-containing protein [Vibrio sp. SCSIO 43135]|uniref:EAL domain-containing protein n=1 Tax=Vibrio sp. SCSIO 43135 TaxID=2819096 RepID=UPI002075B113|nr:EAL domain-containing protein [Vibrio sp. SCSIO 43135]USD43523.1 EAL domain-containing protein [Vibrio sp. SCSIO 43135]
MLYLFSLGGSSSYKLVLNGNLLYGVDEESKTMEFYLNDKERFVLEYLAKYSSSDAPSAARDIELAYQREFSDEFGLYSLKNTIASIRRKYKLITDSHDIDGPKEFINNVFKKGYYINIDVVDSISKNKQLNFDINNYKLSTGAMLDLFIRLYHLSILNKGAKMVVLSSVLLCILYILQISHISSILHKYKGNTNYIAHEIMDYGCDDTQNVAVLSQSLNLDSAILIKNGNSCLIDRESMRSIDSEAELERLLSLPQFVYTSRTNGQGAEFYARISRQSIESRYGNTLLPFLVDSVHINTELGKLLSTGEPGQFQVYSQNFREGAEIVYYSDGIVYEWLGLLALLTCLFYMKNLYRFAHFVTTWIGLRYKLEVIMDTEKSHPVYYEILTRVKRGSPLEYINHLRQSQLVTFHTIATIKAIEAAQQSGASNNYGINLCPITLQGDDFDLLDQFLSRLEANEVTLEITENSTVPYTQEIIENIRYLKVTGFIIALDDFGTGNNNVEVVKKVQPNYLKIDKEFLTDIENDILAKEILINLSNIGYVSDSKIIQEGVETTRQKNFLSRLGYIYQQGYLYSEE